MDNGCSSDPHNGSASSLNGAVPNANILCVSPTRSRKVSADVSRSGRVNGLTLANTPLPSAATSSSVLFSDSESDRRDSPSDRVLRKKSSHTSWFARLSLSHKFASGSKKHVGSDSGVRFTSSNSNSNGSEAANAEEEQRGFTMRWDVQRGLPFSEPVTCLCAVEPGVIAAGSSDKVIPSAVNPQIIICFSCLFNLILWTSHMSTT